MVLAILYGPLKCRDQHWRQILDRIFCGNISSVIFCSILQKFASAFAVRLLDRAVHHRQRGRIHPHWDSFFLFSLEFCLSLLFSHIDLLHWCRPPATATQKIAVTVGTADFVSTSTTSRSKTGNFRPPTKSPQPALRGGVRPAGGRKRPPAFFLHFFLLLHSTFALCILPNGCLALPWRQTAQYGVCRLTGARMLLCCKKRHTGLHLGNSGVSGGEAQSVLRTSPHFLFIHFPCHWGSCHSLWSSR